MRLCISGPARSGKDCAAEWFVTNCGLTYYGSTSSVILPYAAKWLGVSEEQAWESRHDCRMLWRELGDELRRNDPGFLAREVLKHGHLCVGIRSLGELKTVIEEELVDALLWIDRDVPHDPTLEYGVDDFPFVVIPNRGTPEMFKARLTMLARSWGLL